MAQELLTTFNDDNLSAVTMMPNRPPPGARFTVSYRKDSEDSAVLWDREKEGGFPEVKELKQLVRDQIDPDLYLGHSDTEKRDDDDSQDTDEAEVHVLHPPSSKTVLETIIDQVSEPNIAIRYCTGCRWLLRSAYFATELMSTFSEEINSITLIPSRTPEKGGVFVSTLRTATHSRSCGLVYRLSYAINEKNSLQEDDPLIRKNHISLFSDCYCE